MRDRPAKAETDEIEITPAMIEAGIDALYSSREWVDESIMLDRIFRAMVRASHIASRKEHCP